MEDHTFVRDGPVNSGLYEMSGEYCRRKYHRRINSERSHEMRISFVVVTKSRARGDLDFLEREVRRHFETWQGGEGDSKFKLRWIAGDLVLTTNNRVLVHKWLEVERWFVEHVIQPEQPMLVDSPIVLEEDDCEWSHYIAA